MSNLVIVCGHYGCGKTNLVLNMALEEAKKGKKVTVIDLDLVNPYFRSSDYKTLLEAYGVEIISPIFANTTIDVPSISPRASVALEENENLTIVDLGGDDVGSTVLGSFSKTLKQRNYEMLYVVNRYRAIDNSTEETKKILREIESVTGLKATAVVNNSHLKSETTKEIIENAYPFAKKVADELSLPLIFTTVPKNISVDVKDIKSIEVLVKSPWE